MINFIPSVSADRDKILRWIEADSFHTKDASDEMATAMVTGEADCILSCAVKDEMGLVLYLQLTQERDLVRIGAQFGPPEEVSKARVAEAIKLAMPALRILSEQKDAKGMIFFSNSPALIKFMSTFGFKPQGKDQYVWIFQENS
jgi:hypothetical protein